MAARRSDALAAAIAAGLVSASAPTACFHDEDALAATCHHLSSKAGYPPGTLHTGACPPRDMGCHEGGQHLQG
jgi:hypothetical protein